MPIKIIDLNPNNPDHIEQTARVALAGFANSPSFISDLAEALEEVNEALTEDGINRIALGEDGAVLGWVAVQPGYDGRAWELHPLVVHPDWLGQGVGRALMADIEAQVRARGGLTIWLGTDDEVGNTSLTDVDVYADVPAAIRDFSAAQAHPSGFYRRVGYQVVGIIPDANGPGRHDVLLAKRL